MRTILRGLAMLLVTALFQGALAQGSYEPNVDRPGADYRNFDIRGGSAACQAACANDGRCVAWTFVQRSVQSASERCWLKAGVPSPRGDACCVSGIMRPAGGQAASHGPAGGPVAAADANCCPTNTLVCPAGRHFCTSAASDAAAGRRQPYNPAWQAAPGDTSCCPNSMLVCPMGRHFCPR